MRVVVEAGKGYGDGGPSIGTGIESDFALTLMDKRPHDGKSQSGAAAQAGAALVAPIEPLEGTLHVRRTQTRAVVLDHNRDSAFRCFPCDDDRSAGFTVSRRIVDQ